MAEPSDLTAGAAVGDVGEFGLIERVVARFALTPDVLLGPGDDAAVIAAPDGRVVATTDVLVEGRHFRRDWSSAHEVGRKAAAQNLADIVAMGARPTALLVGLAAPADLPAAWALELADGLAEECALVGATVAGGDVVRSDTVVIAVTALGDLEGREPVTRGGARVGDAWRSPAGSAGPRPGSPCWAGDSGRRVCSRTRTGCRDRRTRRGVRRRSAGRRR